MDEETPGGVDSPQRLAWDRTAEEHRNRLHENERLRGEVARLVGVVDGLRAELAETEAREKELCKCRQELARLRELELRELLARAERAEAREAGLRAALSCTLQLPNQPFGYRQQFSRAVAGHDTPWAMPEGTYIDQERAEGSRGWQDGLKVRAALAAGGRERTETP